MKVRTIRRHVNRHGPQPTKNFGRIYTVGDVEGQNLIAAGLVEEHKPEADEAES